MALFMRSRPRGQVGDVNCVHVFGMHTAFGGGKSSGFALLYDNLAAAKKFEPKHRIKRKGIEAPQDGSRNGLDDANSPQVCMPAPAEDVREIPQILRSRCSRGSLLVVVPQILGP